jgi:hypothetical protein
LLSTKVFFVVADIPLELPSEDLILDKYLATGLQEGEHVLPDDAEQGTHFIYIPGLYVLIII